MAGEGRIKHKTVISSAVLLLVAITGFYFYVNLTFSNPEFRYGDLNY